MKTQTRAFTVACTLAACTSTTPSTNQPAPAVDLPTSYVMTDPEVFPLNIPTDFFVRDGRGLSQYPEIESCHMQGATIAGDLLVLSCVVYNEARSEERTYIGRSYLLSAPLCDIVGCDGEAPGAPDWRISEITEPVPASENLRITRNLLGREPLSDEERAVRHLLNHPSGLTHDRRRGGVWVGNAGYAGDTYARVMLFDPTRIGEVNGADALARSDVQLPRHTNSVALLGDRYLFSPTWGSKNFAILDARGEAEPAIIANPFHDSDDHVDIQDCIEWRTPYVVCSGNRAFYASPDAPDIPLPRDITGEVKRDALRVRLGRVQVLRVDTAHFPKVSIELVGYIKARLPRHREPQKNLGLRKYRYDAEGNQEYLAHNDYGGGYTLVTTLTYEGFAVDPSGEYVYFVPDDLPASKLVRLRLTRE